jgi:hypothetical protein
VIPATVKRVMPLLLADAFEELALREGTEVAATSHD